MNTAANTLDSILTLIVQKHMDIETLETRHGDSLDFHDVAAVSYTHLTLPTIYSV